MVGGFCSRRVLFVVDTQNQSGCLTGKYRERILSRLRGTCLLHFCNFCLVDATVPFRALQLSRQQRTSNEIETWILDIKNILASPSIVQRAGMLAFPSSTPAEKPYINLVNSTQVCNPQSVPHLSMLLIICHSVCKEQLPANEARMEKNDVASGDTVCIAEESEAL